MTDKEVLPLPLNTCNPPGQPIPGRYRLNPCALVLLLLMASHGIAQEQPLDTASREASGTASEVQDRGTALPSTSTLPSINALNENLLQVYRQKIDALEAVSSTYDPQLGESLGGMGRVLQSLGLHQEAINAYRRAMHIERINNGIFSLSQEPMLRGLMTSYRAINDVENMEQSMARLYTLYDSNLDAGDPRRIPILREIGNWHLSAYQQAPGRAALYHLGNSHRLIVEAIHLAALNHLETGVQVALWHDLAVTNYQLAGHNRHFPAGRRTGFTMSPAPVFPDDPLDENELLAIKSYDNGRFALEQIVTTLYQDPDASPEQKAEALAELGDWHLLFGRPKSAANVYRESWKLVARDDEPRNALFGTPHPIAMQPLPASFTASAPDETSAPQGADPYVLAQFTVNEEGKPKALQILEAQPPQDEDLARTTENNIKSLVFRPQLQDGEMVATNAMIYRFNMARP